MRGAPQQNRIHLGKSLFAMPRVLIVLTGQSCHVQKL